MRVNREEEKLSRLADRPDLRGLFYAIPRIERGRVFRFMKRRGWQLVPSAAGYNAVIKISSILVSREGFYPGGAARFVIDQLLAGKTLEQIAEEAHTIDLSSVK